MLGIILGSLALLYGLNYRKKNDSREYYSATDINAVADSVFYLKILPKIVEKNKSLGGEIEICLRGN